MPPIKIIRQQQQSELLGNGRVEQIVRIDFTIGDDGPFSVFIPQADYTADRVHAEILKIANQTVALRDKLASS